MHYQYAFGCECVNESLNLLLRLDSSTLRPSLPRLFVELFAICQDMALVRTLRPGKNILSVLPFIH